MPDKLPSLLFFVLGVGLIIMSFVTRRKAKAALKWPVSPATIVSSEVRKRVTYDSDSSSNRTTYEPVVTYQYSVMGAPYDGSRISFGDKKTSRKKAAEIVARYPVGSQVNARYNPEKAEEVVLETTARGSTGNLIFGLLFLVLGVVVLIVL